MKTPISRTSKTVPGPTLSQPLLSYPEAVPRTSTCFYVANVVAVVAMEWPRQPRPHRTASHLNNNSNKPAHPAHPDLPAAMACQAVPAVWDHPVNPDHLAWPLAEEEENRAQFALVVNLAVWAHPDLKVLLVEMVNLADLACPRRPDHQDLVVLPAKADLLVR